MVLRVYINAEKKVRQKPNVNNIYLEVLGLIFNSGIYDLGKVYINLI